MQVHALSIDMIGLRNIMPVPCLVEFDGDTQLPALRFLNAWIRYNACHSFCPSRCYRSCQRAGRMLAFCIIVACNSITSTGDPMGRLALRGMALECLLN